MCITRHTSLSRLCGRYTFIRMCPSSLQPPREAQSSQKNDTVYYFWTVTDEITKRRRKTRYRMTEKVAFERHGADAQKVADIPGETYPDLGSTGDFLKGPRPK